MKLRIRKVVLVVMCCLLLIPGGLSSQTYEVQGQLSGWVTYNEDDSSHTQVGLRYIPSLFMSKDVTGKHSIDAELSLNSYGTGIMHELNDIETDGKIKPYRLWLRFSGSQFEVRLGLQKINFGSAMLLRPLMWFDRIDPRDPLQLTDGVYGALFRYYFLNNANIWLWGLYGTDDPKGWEIVPSDDNTIEYGGRFQYPVLTGEIAFTYHHREMDLKKGLNDMISNVTVPIPLDFLKQLDIIRTSASEDRFGLDAKWDMEVGVWFEGVMMHQDIDPLLLKYLRFINIGTYQRVINFGCDYTLGLGNGLHLLGEYFIMRASEEAFGSGEGFEFSALSVNYPLGLVDNFTAIVYYDRENHDWYRFINWQRTYDNWRFYLIGFWNPDQFQLYQNQERVNTFAGKGVQIMAVFNH